MSRSIRDFLAFSLILNFAPSVAARTPTVEALSRLKITVQVYNYAHVPAQILELAEKDTSRIFQQAGIEIDWSDRTACAAEGRKPVKCDRALTPTDLILMIHSAPAPALTGLSDLAFGFALLKNPEGRNTYASVFYEPIVKLTSSVDYFRFELLGHVIAHEIGHLLLGSNAHSRAGIMQARWEGRTAQAQSLGVLLFSPAQAKVMQAEVLARMSADKTPVRADLASPK